MDPYGDGSGHRRSTDWPSPSRNAGWTARRRSASPEADEGRTDGRRLRGHDSNAMAPRSQGGLGSHSPESRSQPSGRLFVNANTTLPSIGQPRVDSGQAARSNYNTSTMPPPGASLTNPGLPTAPAGLPPRSSLTHFQDSTSEYIWRNSSQNYSEHRTLEATPRRDFEERITSFRTQSQAGKLSTTSTLKFPAQVP